MLSLAIVASHFYNLRPLRPRVVIKSSGESAKRHFWYVLWQAAAERNGNKAQMLTKILQESCGTDERSTGPAQCGRLPGTRNAKVELRVSQFVPNPSCQIEEVRLENALPVWCFSLPWVLATSPFLKFYEEENLNYFGRGFREFFNRRLFKVWGVLFFVK